MDGWGSSGFVEFKPNLKQTNWMNLIGLFEMNGLNGLNGYNRTVDSSCGQSISNRNKTNLGCPIHYSRVGLMKYDQFPLIHSPSWQLPFTFGRGITLPSH